MQPTSLRFLVEQGGAQTSHTLTIEEQGCEPITWSVTADATWLDTQPVGEQIQVDVDPQGLDAGQYAGAVIVDAGEGVLGSPVQVPVTLIVAEELHYVRLPLVLRRY